MPLLGKLCHLIWLLQSLRGETWGGFATHLQVATNTRIASQPADKSVLKAKPSTSIPNKEASAAVAQPAMPEKDAECPENKPIRK